MKTNCYHLRNSKDVKTQGGMTHCNNYDEAALQACSGLDIKVSLTGRVYFANSKGEEVRVYLSVHPEHTSKGKLIADEIERQRNLRIESM